MSYQVLARKWRPRGFAEMVGQEHVLRALSNALDSGRLHHAFLFTGTRGVGKTTIARILAKSLNCEEGVSATPCGQCATCKEIDDGRFIDLIEVDAASRTKVEDTRELLDNVQYKKNEWQNRNRIKTSQGWQWVTVPVGYRFPQKINEVSINNAVHWARKHLQALISNYNKAPFFNEYVDFFEKIYQTPDS